MHKHDPNESFARISGNFCAVLPLSLPPKNWSTSDWYWKKICGIPFLVRNILNIQRAGLDSLFIFGNEGDAKLYKRLCEEKKITIKINWVTNIEEVIKSTENHPILILNSSVLYTRLEIQSGMNSLADCTETSIQFLKHETMSKTLSQLILGNEFLLGQPIGNSDSGIIFLPIRKDSLIKEPRDFITQQEHLLKTSGLNNDSFMDRTITRFFSRQFTRLFLQTPLSPNMITLLSLFIGLSSAVFFFQGTYASSIIGAGLFLLSAWIDCTDGEIARLKFMESKIGGKLDILCDNLVHISIFFSIGMGLYQATGQSVFKLLGAFSVLGSVISFMLLSSSILIQKEKVSGSMSGLKIKNDLTDKLANRDFVYFLFLMAIIGRVDVFICITAIGSNLFAAYLTYSRFKSSPQIS